MWKPLFLPLLCFAFALTGCTTTAPQTQPSAKMLKHGENRISYFTPKHKPKKGNLIAFYPEVSYLLRPYRIIGKETISRYNFIGLKRQSKTMAELMKSLAASMGGDAVINISADNQKMEGTVISFEKVVL